MRIFYFLLLFFIILNCTEMKTSQIQSILGKEVYSRYDVIEKFQIGSVSLKERCPQSNDALNYFINEGFADEFSKPFYIKSIVDACFILFLSYDCPTTNDTSTQISFYKNIIYHCKLKSPFSLDN